MTRWHSFTGCHLMRHYQRMRFVKWNKNICFCSDLSTFYDYVKDEATIRSSRNEKIVLYRIYTLWYYLYQMKVPGMGKSKFDPRFKLAKVILIIVHNNTEEESLFSRVKKNLPQRASLSLHGTLSSVMFAHLLKISQWTGIVWKKIFIAIIEWN